MSVLENLRRRSWLMVVVIGGALLAFVLTGLFEGGGMNQNNTNAGEIAGESIDIKDFNVMLENAINNKKANEQKTSLTEQERSELTQTVWNQLINEKVMSKEYEALGINVSDEELREMMITKPHPNFLRYISNPQTGQVAPAFADEATGQVSIEKIKAYVLQMNAEQEAQWVGLENLMREVKTVEKYSILIKKGLYVTTSQAKKIYEHSNRNANVEVLALPYSSLSDSEVSYDDNDLNDYYKRNKNKFKQGDSRDIEYVAFNISPSEEDNAATLKSVTEILNKFKSTESTEDDSLLVISEADARYFDETFYTNGSLSPSINDTMFESKVGTVVGPYEENGALKISKLIATKIAADSAKLRHILISYKGAGVNETITRTKEEAKDFADSLANILQKRRSQFVPMVALHSDDTGKNKPANKKEGEDYKGKDGNYGWLNDKSGFFPEFVDAGLDGKRGDLKVVESPLGYHIIEVLNRKGAVKKVQVATIDRIKEPSNKTLQRIFATASTFAGQNTTYEQFQEAATEQQLVKRKADNITEDALLVRGIESSKSLVRWIYENDKGTVSEPKQFGNNYIVAVISNINEKGFAPLDRVKDVITDGVIKEKKAEVFATKFEEALEKSEDFNEIAKQLGITPQSASNINFNSRSIGSIGNEPTLTGTLASLPANKVSKVIKGNNGVYICKTTNVNDAPITDNVSATKAAAESRLAPRAEYEAYSALKENANISNHLVKFY